MKDPVSYQFHCFIALFFVWASALSAQTLVSFQPASPGVRGIAGGTRIDGQTFTVSSSGTVGLVSILAQAPFAVPTSVTFAIRQVSGGLPTSSILASVTIAGTGMSASSLGAFSADFSSQNITFTTGEVYALTVAASSTFFIGGVVDAYTGGAHVTSNNSGASFVQFVPSQDLNFTISAAAIPEPSTYALLVGAAVLGLAAFHRRKLRRSPATVISK